MSTELEAVAIKGRISRAGIVSLLEGRAEAVDQFKKAQDAAEMTFASLRRRLAGLRTYVASVSALHMANPWIHARN